MYPTNETPGFQMDSLNLYEWIHPHNFCCAWDDIYRWPMVAGDLIIAFSYFVISTWLYRSSTSGHGPALLLKGRFLLGAFVFLCGVGHLLDVVKVWWPICNIVAIERVITAVISLMTALWCFKYRKPLSDLFGIHRK